MMKAPINRRRLGLMFAGAAGSLNWLIPAGPAHGQLPLEYAHPHSGSEDQGGRREAQDPDAERFVQNANQRLTAIISDPHLDQEQKVSAFQTAIEEMADLPKIMDFMLGKYSHTLTPKQREQFAAAFRAYGRQVCRYWAISYPARTVRVTGSTVRKPGDVIVYTEVLGAAEQPIRMAWRVLRGKTWKVFDIKYKGAWLGVTKQHEFVSILADANGDIDVLIAKLEEFAARPLTR